MGKGSQLALEGGKADDAEKLRAAGENPKHKWVISRKNGPVYGLFAALMLSALLVVALTIILSQAAKPLPVQTIIFMGLTLAFAVSLLGFMLFQHALKSDELARQLSESQSILKRKEAELQSLQLTQRKTMKAYREEKIRAEEASRSKATFLAHLSHDIRTPLNHIVGFAELISQQTHGPVGHERYLAYVSNIKQSGDGLLTSVADVLELAQLESGQRILASEEILVDDLLRGLHRRFEPRAKRCGINLEVDCFCASVLVGDKMGYERMLENILDNAVRFTPSGGKIRMSAWVADDGVVLEITDTGIGIPPSRLADLFNPFSLTDAYVRKNNGGMGIGLAISQALAELSGGQIAVDSTPSIGTTFAISLPFKASGEANKSVAA